MSDENGYPKWGKKNTSTVPNDPANEINRAKGEPNKAAPSVKISGGTTTVGDGTSSTQYSAETDPVLKHLSKAVPSIGNLSQPEKQHYPPCINPTCKSYGKSHPNCLCYAGPGGSSLEQGHFASGGQVCSGPHQKSCMHFANGGEAEANSLHLNNPQNALDNVGVQHGLLHLLSKVGHNGRSENNHKHLEDYVDSSKKGHKSLDSHISKLIGHEKLDLNPNKEDTESLKNHLNDLQQNPEKAFDVGGNMGEVLPGHAAALGAKTANAVNYFNSLKPAQSQNSPLDSVIPENKSAKNAYERQLKIAQNPMLILHHAKHGTLQPQDLKTLHTIYPSLGQSMTNKAGEALIEAKQKGVSIPRNQKHGLSTLLGQSLDSTQTPIAMQAIIRANAPTQAPQGQKQPKKASGTELKQIDKTNEMFATPSQSRLMDKKS